MVCLFSGELCLKLRHLIVQLLELQLLTVLVLLDEVLLTGERVRLPMIVARLCYLIAVTSTLRSLVNISTVLGPRMGHIIQGIIRQNVRLGVTNTVRAFTHLRSQSSSILILADLALVAVGNNVILFRVTVCTLLQRF